VQDSDDPNVCLIEMPYDLLDAVYSALSDVMMKRIVDFRKYGDKQQSLDYFDLHIRMTELIREWETNTRNQPF